LLCRLRAQVARFCALHVADALRQAPCYAGDVPGALTHAFLELDAQVSRLRRAFMRTPAQPLLFGTRRGPVRAKRTCAS